jgi:PAS domain S-box-containing protein
MGRDRTTSTALHGDGVCAELARGVDWSSTPLGPISSWSPRLTATANVVLCARHPMLLFWGPEHVQLYNDAFIPSFGTSRHPAAMGQRGKECWPEAWPTLRKVLEESRRGISGWRDEHLVPIQRGGHLEEAFWTYSYSPAFEEDGRVAGTLFICNDTTSHVLGKRRARTLRALATQLAEVKTASELTPMAVEILRTALSDVPFVVAYELGDDGVPIVRRTNLTEHHEALVTIGAAVANRVEAARSRGSQTISTTLDVPPLALCGAPWPEPVTRSFIATLPRSTNARSTEVLVFGLSPRLPFNAVYKFHLEQIVETIADVRERVEASQARTKAESQRMDLLRQAPIATVLSTGPEQRIEFANDAFVELHGNDPTGKTFAEAFPDLVGGEVHRLVQRVYTAGESLAVDEHRVVLPRNGVASERWLKFDIRPIRDDAGNVYGALATAVDITDTVLARHTLERCSTEHERLLAGAEAASRAKDEFFAMLGHELRNPLAPIMTALHLMKLKEPDALVREREIIARQAAHLVKLVDDLLDVARVARGKVMLDRARVQLGEVIARAVETASPLFEEKRHLLTVEVPSHGLDVDGDALRLGQVFANLLTNAAKYTEPGGRISASAERDGDAVVVRVEDNGVGIPSEQIPLLFDAFFQGPRSPDRAQGGLGLGLALVKSFVALHGGSVAAKSRDGGGSIFEVRLPALADPPEAPAPQALEPTSPMAGPSETKRVLLVDDSDDILEIFSSLLRLEGYEVVATHDAPSALRVAPSFRPNVAVLDIGLPAMDGYELAAHLRKVLGDHAPKLIAMTGYGQEADRERARRAGFAAHLVKPVDPQELLASVRT